MLDINLIREKPEEVRAALQKRQMDAAPVQQVLDLDLQRRAMLQQAESLKAERNAVSKDSARRMARSARTLKRSTTASILCLRFRSNVGS